MFFYMVMAFIIGALVGSFLNVCISRLPGKDSMVSPPSHCTSCRRVIVFYDAIPPFSWLMLGDRGRNCGTRIALRYFFVEIFTALLATALVWRFGLQPLTFIYFGFIAALVVVAFIDLYHGIIPDVISIPGLPVGFFCAGAFIGFLNSGIGILIGGGSLLTLAFFYRFFTGREGMGNGDIKLLAMIGAFIGWKGVLFTLFVSSATGILAGLLIMILQKKGMRLAIPFGPFLSLGALFYLFIGPALTTWYLSLTRIS